LRDFTSGVGEVGVGVEEDTCYAGCGGGDGGEVAVGALEECCAESGEVLGGGGRGVADEGVDAVALGEEDACCGAALEAGGAGDEEGLCHGEGFIK